MFEIIAIIVLPFKEQHCYVAAGKDFFILAPNDDVFRCPVGNEINCELHGGQQCHHVLPRLIWSKRGFPVKKNLGRNKYREEKQKRDEEENLRWLFRRQS